jgi:pyrroloquinoline-quinone synthase
LTKLFGRREFVEALSKSLRERYQDRHPLMLMLYDGKLTHKQMKAWIINRFYLQKSIPLKDAAIVSNCPEPDVRKMWISRMLRREGIAHSIGDIEGWVGLAEAAGVTRDELFNARFLPGVRFAVDGYVNFARQASWIEGISASLFEYFAKDELMRRLEAFRRHYAWIAPSGLRFFMSRLSQLDVTNERTLGIVMKYCTTRSLQEKALASAVFLSEVNWSINDSIYMNYVIEDRPLTDSIS